MPCWNRGAGWATGLQALATREEIFKSAAKSQGGKAPRKSKANPDPMQAIRQGTEFAIAQLEAVYTSRRRTEQEIRRIDSRIAAAKNQWPPGRKTLPGFTFHRHGAGSRHATPLPARAGRRAMTCTWMAAAAPRYICPGCSAGHFQAICCRLLQQRWQNATLPVYSRSTPDRLQGLASFRLPVVGCTFRNRPAELIFIRAEEFGTAATCRAETPTSTTAVSMSEGSGLRGFRQGGAGRFPGGCKFMAGLMVVRPAMTCSEIRYFSSISILAVLRASVQIVVDCGADLLVFEVLLDTRAGLLELDLLGGLFLRQLDDMDSRTGFQPHR